MSALFIAVFLACAVESFEAATIVLAAGATSGWKSTMQGVGAALAILVVGIGLLHSTLTLIPLQPFRVVTGLAMGYYGVTWLRKAVLRSAGRKALHDENAIYAETVAGGKDGRRLAFSGVLMEGAEIAVIAAVAGVGHPTAALLAGLSAVLVVAGIAAAVRAPLSRVPENQMKMVVAVLLCSFSIFWVGEGLNVRWPGSDAILFAFIAAVTTGARVAVRLLRSGELVEQDLTNLVVCD